MKKFTAFLSRWDQPSLDGKEVHYSSKQPANFFFLSINYCNFFFFFLHISFNSVISSSWFPVDLESYSDIPLCHVSTQYTSQFLNCTTILLAYLLPSLVLDFLNSNALPGACERLENKQAFTEKINEYPFSAWSWLFLRWPFASTWVWIELNYCRYLWPAQTVIWSRSSSTVRFPVVCSGPL